MAARTPQYWVSMPAIRKIIFDEKLNDSKLPSDIKNLDDVFFKRDFVSYIFKEANINNRPISDSILDPDAAPLARKIELEMIETEHDLWGYTQ